MYNLPAESVTMRNFGAPKPGEWAAGDELLRVLLNETRYANHMFMTVHAEKGTKVPEPVWVHRPGEDVRNDVPKPASAEKLASVLRGAGMVHYSPKDEA